MSESMDSQAPRGIPSSEEIDRPTHVLLWAVVGAALALTSLVAYGFMSGAFGSTVAPRSAQEDALATTAAAIAKDPSDGRQYAVRAEALYAVGNKAEAFRLLDQGEKAAAGQNPGLLYVLRSRTALLNDEGKFAEAEAAGQKAMTASDDYLATQGLALAKKGVTGISGNVKTQVSVDTALQVAEAYMGLKKYDKSIEMYNYALRLEPTAADIISMRGWAYLERGSKSEAKADFQQTLKYLPDDQYAVSGMKELSN